jgi:Zn-finger protein
MSESYQEWYDKNIKGKKGEDEYSHRFYQNKNCEFYPCHKGVDDKEFSCLHCYCPLMCQDDCIGIQSGYGKLIEGTNGKLIKDCSGCTIPHEKKNYDLMMNEITKFIY